MDTERTKHFGAVSGGNLREYYARGIGVAGDVGSLVAETRFGGGDPETVFLHADWRGGVVLATDAAGNAVGRYGYSAYGEPFAADAANRYAPRFGFSSKERDASGLVYYGFRHASPELCRWITPDPARESGGLNLYAFCGGNPVCYVDDDGKFPLVISIALIASTVYFVVDAALNFWLANKDIDSLSERRNLVYQSSHCEDLLEENLDFKIICEAAKCAKIAAENMPATSFALSPLSGSSRPRVSATPPIYNQKLPGRPGYQRVRGSIRENGTYVAPYYRRKPDSKMPLPNNALYPR